MKKIILNVNDEQVESVMFMLKNMKEGLISSIEGEEISKRKGASYVPKTSKVVYENEKPGGKYASASAYRERLKRSKS